MTVVALTEELKKARRQVITDGYESAPLGGQFLFENLPEAFFVGYLHEIDIVAPVGLDDHGAVFQDRDIPSNRLKVVD